MKTRVRNLFFYLILVLIPICTNAQLTLLKGTILDALSKEPVPYAHLVLEDSGIGVSSSLEGEYEFVLESKFEGSKIQISCIGYENRVVEFSQLNESPILLQPDMELLEEVVVTASSKLKNIKLGSKKGKRTRYLTHRDVTQIAQFILNEEDPNCNYLREVTFTFRKAWHLPAKARLRIYDKHPVTGMPNKDLLKESVLMDIYDRNKPFKIDLTKFQIVAPEEGFFVTIEKLIIPSNMTFIASIEKSTYPKYVVAFKKDEYNHKGRSDVDLEELWSFEKYRTEVSLYKPTIDFVKETKKQKGYGAVYILKNGKWIMKEWEDDPKVMAVEVLLSN